MTVTPLYHDSFDDVTIRLDPFTGWNWKSQRTREQWGEMIARMRGLREHAEWKSVASNDTDRQMAIIHLSEQNMEEWMERIGNHNLKYRTIRYTEPYDGFSHKHFPTTKNDPQRICYAAIAPNEDILDTVEEAEHSDDPYEKHETVGELLGFPTCCREHFKDVWLDGGKIDPMYEAACNTPSVERTYHDDTVDKLHLHDPSPWVNVMWRYFGLSFITHLPCSFECEQSKHVAYERAKLMQEKDDEAAKALKTWLDAPFTWSGHNGIAHIRNEIAIGQCQTTDYFIEKEITWKDEHAAGGKVPGTSDGANGTTF